MPGRYVAVCWLAVLRNDEEIAHQSMKMLEFVVFGVAKGEGIIAIPGKMEVQVDGAPTPEAKP